MMTFVIKDTITPKTYGVFSDRIKADEFVDYLKYAKGIESEWVIHWIDFNLPDLRG